MNILESFDTARIAAGAGQSRVGEQGRQGAARWVDRASVGSGGSSFWWLGLLDTGLWTQHNSFEGHAGSASRR